MVTSGGNKRGCRRALLVLPSLLLVTSLMLAASSRTIHDMLLEAVAKQQDGLKLEAERLYRKVLSVDRDQPDALHLLGVLAHEDGRTDEGVQLIRRAIQRDEELVKEGEKGNPALSANLGELLRSVGRLDEAADVLERGLKIFGVSPALAFNLAAVREDQGRADEQEMLLNEVLLHDPLHWKALSSLASMSFRAGDFQRARKLYVRAVQISRGERDAVLGLGLSEYRLGLVQRAYATFESLLRADPTDSMALLNMAAMLQVDGRFDEALDLYDSWLSRDPENVAMLNNKAAILLSTNREDEAASIFEHALVLNPDCSECLINLAAIYQDDGLMVQADQFFRKAYEATGNVGLLIRRALSLPPVIESGMSIASTRAELEERVRSLLLQLPPGAGGILDPVSAVERVHFYMVYHGQAAHDRLMQELASQVYLKAWPGLLTLAPHCHSPDLSVLEQRAAAGPVRVGFMSRFFGEKEPHGLLLEGIMRHMPRTRFRVVRRHYTHLALALPSHKGGPSFEVAGAVDEMHHLSLNFATARTQAQALQLDVLVFGEMNSEPLNHFLGFSRLAPVQVLFWGNPVTSGNPSIDFFVSADIMETPTRTQMQTWEEPYSEQVVLLDGQGIWYSKPQLPSTFLPRSSYGLNDTWTIYMCAQSLFKMHPDMDAAFAEILQLDSKGHLVFLEGRRQRWTATFRQRLAAAGCDMNRVHFLERVPAGDAYLQVLHVADVVLHPFPFGGSRTSAEALLLGKPLVALANGQLRGRMAISLYRTMGLEQRLVAPDIARYVQLAVKLGRDVEYRRDVAQAISARVDRIWSRLDVAFEWTRFLARITGQSPPSPTEVGYPSWEAYARDLEVYDEESAPLTAASAQELGSTKVPTGIGDDDGGLLADQLVAYGARLRALGELEAALFTMEEALALRPGDATLHNDIGAILQELWRLEEAEKHLRLAVELKDGYQLAMNNLGVTLHGMGRLDEAVLWYRRSLEGKTWRDGRTDLCLNNLGNLLRDAGRLEEAVELYISYLELPPAHKGGGVLAFLSLLELDPGLHLKSVAALERDLIGRGRLELSPGASLWSVVTRLRGASTLVTNSLVIALDRLGLLQQPSAMEIVAQLSGGVEAPPLMAAALNDTAAAAGSVGLPEPGDIGRLNLLTGYFVPTDDALRRWELDTCLLQNLANPYISAVHVLLESSSHDPRAWLPPNLARRLHVSVIGRRPEFADVFQYANERLGEELCIVANADVFTDHSLARLYPPSQTDMHGKVFALLRWELEEADLSRLRSYSRLELQGGGGGGPGMMPYRAFHRYHEEETTAPYRSVLRPRIDSQDAWVFRAPLPRAVLEHSKFLIGAARCDNRLAHVLAETAGLAVHGPSFALKVTHVHYSKSAYHIKGSLPDGVVMALGRENSAGMMMPWGYTGKGQINGDLAFVHLSDQWLF